jgi:hypothetical protein
MLRHESKATPSSDTSARPFIEALWAIAARLEREERERATRDKSEAFDSLEHIPNA